MGEVMKILSSVLPKDVIHYHIQPYLMIGARQAKIKYYQVLAEMRQQFKIMRQEKIEEERHKLRKRLRLEKAKRDREDFLRTIHEREGWDKCRVCLRERFIAKLYDNTFPLCRDCYKNKTQVMRVIERWPGGSQMYLVTMS
jgi:hypothetical protein